MFETTTEFAISCLVGHSFLDSTLAGDALPNGTFLQRPMQRRSPRLFFETQPTKERLQDATRNKRKSDMTLGNYEIRITFN